MLHFTQIEAEDRPWQFGRLIRTLNKMLPHLRMFLLDAIPGRIDRLLEMAQAEDMRLARTALDVLANITDHRLRELGVTLISERRWIGRAVGLLVRNAQPGDYRILEELLGDASLDEDAYHGLETGARHFARRTGPWTRNARCSGVRKRAMFAVQARPRQTVDRYRPDAGPFVG